MSEQSLPIDIHLKKLLDWLVSRRICNREWHENIRAVREKIGHAIGDMPEHPKIKELLSGAHINYWHCVEIVDILKETEKDTKNFFGQYGSQRMALWKDVVSLYERDNIYLGEAAQLLAQAVSYDLPGLKKHIVKLTQVQEECDKKEKENEKKSVEFRNEFLRSCQQLGISGDKPRKEVIALLDDLPKIYSDLTASCRKLQPAIDYYKNFVGSSEIEVLPTLRFLIERGNVTTYEWTYGEAPLSIEEPKLDFGVDNDDEDTTVSGGGGGDGNVEIDFDLDMVDLSEVELEAPVEIDWGELDGGNNDDVADVKIDWDAVDLDTEVQVEETGNAGGVARDSDALSILDNRKTRNLLLDDLHELECFLVQRKAESADTSFSSLLLGSSLSQELNSEDLDVMKCDVSGVISYLTTGKLHHLQLVKTSPAYVNRLVDNLMQKSHLADKLKSANLTLHHTRDEAIAEQGATIQKLNLMLEKTKELQKQIEKDISKRYQNRKVNIMGGVQSV